MYDVIIIGSGVIGATIARELSKYNLKAIILEKEFDVASGATMANSAIVHSGHDPIPGTLKAKFNVLGNRMYKKMSEELDIPFLECGGMVVAVDGTQIEELKQLHDRALKNGLRDNEIRILNQEEVRDMEPNISDTVKKALYLPTTAVTFPWEVAIANIENAMDNGVELSLETEVLDINKDQNFKVSTTKGVFESRVVINAAGIYADKVSNLLIKSNYEIKPRRGEYFVLDSDVNLVNSVIYPLPTEKGKGVIATPQYHGNVLLGPTSDYVDLDDKTKTSEEGISYIRVEISKTIKNVPFNKVIRSFAGSRATSTRNDFIIEETDVKGFINVAGIDSPGLTAAPAISKYVTDLVGKRIKLTKKNDFNPVRRVTRINKLDTEDLNELVKRDHRFGHIVCRCENITEGEVVESIHRTCGARSVVGVKMRVRPGSGRCQGGFCQPEVIKILAKELKIDPMDINYNKSGSQILNESTKGEAK
ncbi:NAD(P)/FAD-dependent oxidoreductase [Mycoplasmatota bacterium zrk1]